MCFVHEKSTYKYKYNETYTKHIKLDYHYVQEKALMNQLIVQFVPIFDQKTDILTKPLPIMQFVQLKSKLSVTCMAINLRESVEEIEEYEVYDKYEM